MTERNCSGAPPPQNTAPGMDALNSLLNRVTYGDCVPVLQRLPDACVDLVITDPPYLVHYRPRDGRSIPNDDNSRWLLPAFYELFRVLKPNRYCVSFYGWQQADRFLAAWRACGWFPIGHFACVKPYPSSVGHTQMRHENAYLLLKGRPPMPKYPPHDVLPWDYSGNKLHPTQKPLPTLTPLIKAYSQPREIILDAFAGSGSTGVAARVCDRQFILIEKDWRYYQVAHQRLDSDE